MAAASNENSSTSLLQLYVDCFEHLFEWLPLRNLLVLRQTCTRLKTIVDYYIKEYYPAVKFGKIKLDPKNVEEYKSLNSNDIKLINHIAIQPKNFRYADKFLEIDNVKQIVGQIETIDIDYMSYDEEDFYDRFLKYCQNLKKLTISGIDIDRNCGREWDFKWLEKHYPLLEQIELKFFEADCTEAHFNLPEIKTFFQLNRNIRVFSTYWRTLMETSDSYHKWMQYLALDQFNIMIERDRYFLPTVDRVADMLEYMYERKCFGRLHIYTFKFNQADIDEVITLPLEKLSLREIKGGKIKFTTHSTVKELSFEGDFQLDDPEIAANNLHHVERVHFKRTELKSILPFLENFVKVQKIRVDELITGMYFENGIVDLMALNSIRDQRDGACKLALYVDEQVYLATKWANMPTDCSLIELKRHSSYDWEHIEFRVTGNKFYDSEEDEYIDED